MTKSPTFSPSLHHLNTEHKTKRQTNISDTEHKLFLFYYIEFLSLNKSKVTSDNKHCRSTLLLPESKATMNQRQNTNIQTNDETKTRLLVFLIDGSNSTLTDFVVQFVYMDR